MRICWLVLMTLLALGGCAKTTNASSSTTNSTAGATGGVQTAVTQSVKLTAAVTDQQTTAASYKAGEPGLEDTLLSQLRGFVDVGRQLANGQLGKVTSGSCASGSMTVTSPDSATANPYDVSIVYANCVNSNITTNGTVTVSITKNTDGSATFTVTMGNGDTTADASDLTLTVGSLLTTFSITASGSEDATGSQKTISLSGIMRLDNTSGSDYIQFTASGFSATASVAGSVTTTTLNGALAFSALLLGKSASFQATLSSFTHTVDSSNGSATLNGTLALNNTPATCINGTYTVTTVTPMMFNSSDVAIAGKITVNGATVEYLSDGSVLITMSDGVTRAYTTSQLTSPNVCNL